MSLKIKDPWGNYMKGLFLTLHKLTSWFLTEGTSSNSFPYPSASSMLCHLVVPLSWFLLAFIWSVSASLAYIIKFFWVSMLLVTPVVVVFVESRYSLNSSVKICLCLPEKALFPTVGLEDNDNSPFWFAVLSLANFSSAVGLNCVALLVRIYLNESPV